MRGYKEVEIDYYFYDNIHINKNSNKSNILIT